MDQYVLNLATGAITGPFADVSAYQNAGYRTNTDRGYLEDLANVIADSSPLTALRGAAGATLIGFKETGDAALRLDVHSDGSLHWGDGTNAPDVHLARNPDYGLILTDPNDNSLTITPDGTTAGSYVQFGYDYVTLQIAGGGGALYLQEPGEAGSRLVLKGNGSMVWGGGTDPPDTDLVRRQAAWLETHGTFSTDGHDILAHVGGSGGLVGIGARGPAGQPAITFGDAEDTNLYRSAANTLKTDDQLIGGNGVKSLGDMWADGDAFARLGVTGQIAIGSRGPSGEAGLQFGSSQDTNLYRDGAGQLKTDGQITVGTVLKVLGVTQFANAGSFQTTVGAAGGASALPATPTKYAHLADEFGVTYVFPLYAAS